MMVSIKEATANALTFAREALGPERTADARLEEIVSTKVSGKEAWIITLSMRTNNSPADEFNIAVGLPPKREYKSFTVRRSDGEVTAMKIRELADA